ncbi:MAG: hypothetical protein U1F53_01300 [Burkholderiaceae bacterium]
MALTMTRTRTQKALTKLAERVAAVHGELAYVEGRLDAGDVELREELREGLARRHGELMAMREALYVTLRQFDSALDPTAIGSSDEWLKPFGRGTAGRRRYEAALPLRTA